MSRNSASGLIKYPSGPYFWTDFGVLTVGIWSQNEPQEGPACGGALLGLILGPDPHGMDPKIGPQIGPGRILIKPEALLREIEYVRN